MPLREEAEDWLAEAGSDLERSRRLLREADYSAACFFAQQAAEKALKAAQIALLRRLPTRGHDLTKLYSELERQLSLEPETLERLPELSQYYVVSRYPNAGLRRHPPPSRGPRPRGL